MAEDDQGQPLPNSPVRLPVTIVVANEIFQNFLPTIVKQ
jgi:hypothetical protein